jgi:branched-chain amino acid aminotransferase
MLPKYAYFNGSIIPYDDAKIGVLNHTFNYGTGAFAGVRGYWNQQDEELYLFRTKDHFKRLLNSAKLLRMEFDLSPDDLTRVTIELLQKEGLRQDVYIRPLIYFSDETIGVRLHDLDPAITMAAIPFDKYVSNDESAHVTISSWRRVDDNMVPARGKITGAYINTALIKTDAKKAGFDEALVLNMDGHLSEGSAMNFFMMRDGALITSPVTDNILEGITRRTIMELAREELGLEVVERSVDRTEIYLCDELILTGTAAQVTAATQVDHRKIGDGKLGPVAAQLRQLYDDVVRGKMEKYRHWNTPVFEKMMVK